MTTLHRPAQDPTQPPAGDGGGGWNPVSDLVGGSLSNIAQNAFSSAMQAVWDSAIWLLKGGFDLADTVSQVSPATITGNPADNPDPIPGAAAPPAGAASAVELGSLWPTMIWLAALIALGLFFSQLASVALRCGRGMFRAVTGPAQFGIALAVTTGAVAALLTGADGLTTLFLSILGEQGSFTAILDNPAVADRFGDNPDLGADVEDGVQSMILGIAAVFGVIPAAIGFALAMIFRAAAIMVLIATIPLAAACLISDSTASMFWRTVRWLIAAVLMKPALALVVVIGVAIMSRTHGVAGLLAGTAVLLISLFSPFVLYRLLAFVDPGTSAGMAVRSAGSSRAAGEPGADNGTSEAINTARATQKAYDIGSTSGAGGGAAGGELGGSTAATRGASGSAGTGTAATGGGGAAAGGGVAAGAGAVGGAAAAAVVGGYLATKAAAGAAGAYGSSQMAQTGIGHPGPAPAAGASGGQIRSAAGGAYNATSNRIAQTSNSSSDPDAPGDSSDGDGGGGPEPPPVDPGPTEPTPPDGAGPTTDTGRPAPDPAPGSEEPAQAGADREDGR
ncbi:type IV secretion system protein [Pseudonocardia sp. ICBG1293]|uniref:type IV secretion system protein n=1 Tax=Pseudonocardia sp. ICBG1293 TaxID=2844382 RepID=UPI001CCA9D67|nr:type IV secretion system protein [Pseudonocardia sp. ICBG1293]